MGRNDANKKSVVVDWIIVVVGEIWGIGGAEGGAAPVKPRPKRREGGTQVHKKEDNERERREIKVGRRTDRDGERYPKREGHYLF